jgi:hypothetical protein
MLATFFGIIGFLPLTLLKPSQEALAKADSVDSDDLGRRRAFGATTLQYLRSDPDNRLRRVPTMYCGRVFYKAESGSHYIQYLCTHANTISALWKIAALAQIHFWDPKAANQHIPCKLWKIPCYARVIP